MKYKNIVDKMSNQIEKIKEKNIGKWVAVKDGKVLVASTDFNEVVKETKDIDRIYIFYSPTPEEKKYGYLFIFVVK